jgi:RNA polymerase sigma-70 factor, ECF subfamily
MADSRRETDGDSVVLTALNEAPAATVFSHLYRRYVTAVYSYIYSRVGHRADAEDLTEQTFIEALEGLTRYEEQGKAAAWLFTIARRRVVDHYRAGRQELPFDETLDSPLDFAGPEVELLRRERLARLRRLLAELEEEKLELLQLRFVAGLTYREIGRVVGSSEGAVKVAIYRLLEQLRVRWPVAGFTGSEEASDE